MGEPVNSIAQIISKIENLTLLEWIGIVVVILLWMIAKQLERCWEQLWEIQSSMGNVEELLGGRTEAQKRGEFRRQVEIDEEIDKISQKSVPDKPKK